MENPQQPENKHTYKTQAKNSNQNIPKISKTTKTQSQTLPKTYLS